MADRVAPRFAAVGAVIDRIDAWIVFGLAVALVILTALGFSQVVSRYVFGAPLIWSEELIRIILIWVVCVGVGPAYRLGYLAAIETLVRAVPTVLVNPIRIFTLLVSALIWVVWIVWGTYLLDVLSTMRFGTLDISVTVIYAAAPVGGVVALANTVAMLIDGKVGEHEDMS